MRHPKVWCDEDTPGGIDTLKDAVVLAARVYLGADWDRSHVGLDLHNALIALERAVE